ICAFTVFVSCWCSLTTAAFPPGPTSSKSWPQLLVMLVSSFSSALSSFSHFVQGSDIARSFSFVRKRRQRGRQPAATATRPTGNGSRGTQAVDLPAAEVGRQQWHLPLPLLSFQCWSR